MEAIVALSLAFVLWLFVWSIVSLIKVLAHGSRLEELQRVNTQLKGELNALRKEVSELVAGTVKPAVEKPGAGPAVEHARVETPKEAQPAPLASLESQSLEAVVQPPPPLVLSPPLMTPPALPVLPVLAAAQGEPLGFPSPAHKEPLQASSVTGPTPSAVKAVPAPQATQPSANPAPASSFNWELFMGVRMLAWIGGLAAFFGVALFVKLSIQNNWVSPEVRVAGGFLAGLAMLVAGLVLVKRDLEVLAHTLCAAGVVSLYAVTLACRAYYHFEFFGPLATFLLMTLITGTAFLLASRLRAQVVAILGLLGGYLTPVLLSTGVDNPWGLFAYILLLVCGLIAVALYCRWHYMVLLAAVATTGMQLGWAMRFFAVQKMPVVLVVFLGFALVFFMISELGRRLGRTGKEAYWLNASPLVSAGFALLFSFHLLGYESLLESPLALVTVLLVSDLILLALSVRARGYQSLHVVAGGMAYLWLACWLGSLDPHASLNWPLGAIFLFSLLHVAFPVLMARLRSGFACLRWTQYFPPVALALVLGSTLHFAEAGFLIWPLVLLLDLLAIGFAAMVGSMAGVLLALVLSLCAVATAIFSDSRLPDADGFGLSYVLLAAFFGVLFCAASYFLISKVRRAAASGVSKGSDPALELGASPLLEHLPVLSALLPFTLLILVILRIPLLAPHAVFGLGLLLSILFVGLCAWLEKGQLALVSLLACVALQWSWQASGLSELNAASTLFWALGFYAVFLFQAFVLRKRLLGDVYTWVAAALAGPLQALLIHRLVGHYWPNDCMGVIPVLFAVPSVLALLFSLKQFPESDSRRLNILALFGGVTLLFITAAVPVQFDRQWLTLCWALEGAALLWLFHRIPHPGLRITGVLLLLVTFVRLGLNPSVYLYHVRSDTAIFNWYLYTYGLAIAALFAGARLLAPPRERVFGVVAPKWLQVMGVLLAFLLLNIEIADFFAEPGALLSFQFSGNFARDMTYTVAWALFALGLLVAGIARKNPAARYAALVLLASALLKLFLHDLAAIDQIYRVVAFIGVAFISLLASFLYQRFLRHGADNSATPESATDTEPKP